MISCQTEVKLFQVDKTKIGVTFNGTRGTIFTKNYQKPLFFDSSARWTPNKNEIELAEGILRQEIKETNKGRINQMDNCPVIHRHLNDYFRQYVGIINDKGQRLIHINMYWDKFGLLDRIKGYSDNRLDFKSDYTTVFDGCSYYWQINVNLEEKKLTDIWINGVASIKNAPQQNVCAIAG